MGWTTFLLDLFIAIVKLCEILNVAFHYIFGGTAVNDF
jgi:hypothetical protein